LASFFCIFHSLSTSGHSFLLPTVARVYVFVSVYVCVCIVDCIVLSLCGGR